MIEDDARALHRQAEAEVRKPVPKVPCPKCHTWLSRVTRGESDAKGLGYRRRRECKACGHRFYSIEKVA